MKAASFDVFVIKIYVLSARFLYILYKKSKNFLIIILVYIESLYFYYETEKYSDNLKMQNKVSKK